MKEILSIVVLLEIILLLLGIFSFFIKHNYSIPDSFSFSVVLLFSIYSSLIQLFFIFHIPRYFYYIDILLLIIAFCLIVNNFQHIVSSAAHLYRFFGEFRSILFFPFMLYTYLFLQVLLFPTHEWDSMIYNVARVLMMIQENGLFLQNFSNFQQVNFPVGFDILHFLFLRFYSDWFLSIFCFLSYLVIFMSTYSLVVKLYSNKQLALIIAIFISSLIEIVLQSTSTKNDIPCSAMVNVSFLAAHLFLSSGNILCLILLLSSLSLGLTFKTYFMGFALPFIFLFIIMYYKNLQWTGVSIKKFIKCYSWIFLTQILVILLFIIFSFNNYKNHEGVLGNPQFIKDHTNSDGLKGASLNFVRYLTQSLGLPIQLGGKYVNSVHEQILSRNKLFGMAHGEGLTEDNRLSHSLFGLPSIDNSWYGPLGFLLILPSICYSILRGSRFLKLVAGSLLCFFLLTTYEIGWMPWNNRFFSLFFGGSGVCIAFFMKNRFNYKIIKYLLIYSILTLSYAAFFNMDKQLVNFCKIKDYLRHNWGTKLDPKDRPRRSYYCPGYNVFNWMYFVNNRDGVFVDGYYHDDRILVLNRIIKQNKRLLIIAHQIVPIYPILITRPDLHIFITGPKRFYWKGQLINLIENTDFNDIFNNFDYILLLGVKPLKFLENRKLVYQIDHSGNEENNFLVESLYLYDFSLRYGR